MAEIVNLRLLRKRKQRSDAGKAAAQNRAVHGRPASEKGKEARLREPDGKRLDGHLRRPRDDGDGER